MRIRKTYAQIYGLKRCAVCNKPIRHYNRSGLCCKCFARTHSKKMRENKKYNDDYNAKRRARNKKKREEEKNYQKKLGENK